MKICSKCNQLKSVDEFNKRPNGSPTSYCKPCRSEYCKQDYLKNKSRHNKERYARRKVVRLQAREHIKLIKQNPCFDCGRKFPSWVMEFDHLDPEIKLLNISDFGNKSFSMKKLLEEIAKCDLVCVICHRYRTYSSENIRGVAQW